MTFFKLLEGATSLSAAVQALAPAAHVVRAACPRAAVEAARKVLREEFKITIDENISEGKCRVTCSCYFAKVWQKSLEESGDPETDLPEWLRSGAPVGWKGALAPNGVFPMVDGDMETVKKSMQCGQGSQDKAFNAPATCSPNYTSFADTGSQADAEVKRSLQKGFTQEFDSWKDLVTELGPDSMVNNLGKSIEWLGGIAEPTHRVGRSGVSVTIPASKCTDFVARSTGSLRTATRHTSESSGAWPTEGAGSQGSPLRPRSFASILYAAAHEDPNKMGARTAKRRAKRPERLRFVTRPAEQALKWTRTLLQVNLRGTATSGFL